MKVRPKTPAGPSSDDFADNSKSYPEQVARDPECQRSSEDLRALGGSRSDADSQPLTPDENGRLVELERVVGAGLPAFMAVGSALGVIRDARLYRGTYATFEAYARVRWGLSRVHAHRLIEAAHVAQMLPIGNRPATENVARELVALKEQPEIAAATYVAVTNQKRNATAAEVRTAVKAVTAQGPTNPKDVAATVREALRPQTRPAPGHVSPRERRDQQRDSALERLTKELAAAIESIATSPTRPGNFLALLSPAKRSEVDVSARAAYAWIEGYLAAAEATPGTLPDDWVDEVIPVDGV